jgi:hydrogenase maturation protease
MDLKLVEKIVEAVLYEGYILYPYRASAVKNRQRFNFGVLTPKSYSEAHNGTERWQSQTQCPVSAAAALDVKARFLRLCLREVQRLDQTTGEFHPVESLDVDGKLYQTWQEAVECEAGAPELELKTLTEKPHRVNFSFPAAESSEPLRDKDRNIVGAIVRRQFALAGELEITAAPAGENLCRLTVLLSNTTPFEEAQNKSRDDALLRSLASAHLILSVRNGELISLLDPPEEFAAAAASCENIGTYPVLVGTGGERDCMLSSPIILYDYPQIAPESPGELFDGTEIDEILMLRIMTMTDEEKREMQALDERTRKMLQRTETLPPEEFMKLHGALRNPRALADE